MKKNNPSPDKNEDINEDKLNIILKLFWMKTPIIKMVKIDKDKNNSGNNMFKLLIIFK